MKVEEWYLAALELFSKKKPVKRPRQVNERIIVGDPGDPGPFTAYDRTTPTWRKVEAHIEDRIAMLRSRNDKNLDATDTALVRGRIAELKRLAMLGEDRRRTEEE